MKSIFTTLIALIFASAVSSQEVPSIYSQIYYDDDGKLYFEKNGRKIYESHAPGGYELENMKGSPKGSENGSRSTHSSKGIGMLSTSESMPRNGITSSLAYCNNYNPPTGLFPTRY